MRALALTETADHVCGRYRVRAFAPALEASGWSLTVEGLRRGVVSRLRQLDRAREYEAVLLQRKLLPGWLLDFLRRRSSRLIFDFDDAILYRDSYDPRGPHCPRRARRFRRTVQTADEVIAGNDFLADCALRCGARPENVQVIPTCVETPLYPVTRCRDPGAGVELAWIGSSSTLAGLESRRDLWERVGRDVAGSRLRVICDRYPDLGPLVVVPVAWSGATEAADLAGADVGVSWVPDDLWSQGKCGLKVLQYQAAGLPVVANPVGVHPAMVADGTTGFLASTPEDWVEAIRTLRDDPARRLAMGRAARQLVETNYSIEAWAMPFVSTIAGRTAPRGPHARPRSPMTFARVSDPAPSRGDHPAEG